MGAFLKVLQFVQKYTQERGLEPQEEKKKTTPGKSQQHCCMSQDNMSIVEQLVKLYLQIGFSNKEILALLAHKHSVVISIQPLELYSEV